MGSQQLTPADIAELERLEKILERTQADFLLHGRTLLELREKKLYLRDYSTFEGYCQGRWGYGAKRAQQLMKAAAFWESEKLLVDMGAKKDSPILEATSERQLGKLIQTIKSGSNASRLDTTPPQNKTNLPSIANVHAKSKLPEVLDDCGLAIPDCCLSYWEQRPEIQEMMSAVSRVKCWVDDELKKDNKLLHTMTNSIVADLSRAYQSLEQCKPYAVCTVCQGYPQLKPDSFCDFCGGSGLIAKWRYETQADKRVIVMREKVIAMSEKK